MKILFLTQTTQEGPASRVRGYQMAQFLNQLGCEATVSPGIGPWAYSFVYSHPLPIFKIPCYLFALEKRLFQLSWIKQFDVVVIQKEVCPHSFPFIEKLLNNMEIPFVFDFDDALFVRKPNWLPQIFEKASAVVCGNEFLREYASSYNEKCVVIPSLIDISSYELKKSSSEKRNITLGWIGSRSSWPHLEMIRKPLENILASGGIHQIKIISDSTPSSWKPFVDSKKVQFLKWDLKKEKEQLQQIDIGLAPLQEGRWSEGKCGYKLLQYMACGLPVIGSPVGVQSTLIEEGKNGYLAKSVEEWEQKLKLLLDHREHWGEMGGAGRQKVEQEYSFQAKAPQYKQLLEEVLHKKNLKM